MHSGVSEKQLMEYSSQPLRGTVHVVVTTTIRLRFDRAMTILRYGLPVPGCCTAD